MLARKILFISCFVLSVASCGGDEKSTQTIEQQVAPSLVEMDLSTSPSHRNLIAAGQLGGLLSPTEEVDLDSNEGFLDQLNPLSTSDETERMAFGHAIQDWNKHNYKTAYNAFNKFSKQYPQSPWKSEAILHMGCEARFNGRYSEARTLFEQVISNNQNNDYVGAKKMLSKAQSRLAVLNVMENNPEKAKEGFKALKAQSEDWRLKTYASHWLQRINVQE
jgi:TolA-binding protein